MKRKICYLFVSTIVSLILVVSVSINACAMPAFFNDVPEPINLNTNEFSADAPWYTSAIFWLYYAHILDAAEITGEGYVLYGPNRHITRGQFLTFLGRLAKQNGKNIPAVSVNQAETLDDFIKWALDNHILYGRENGLEEEEILTRQEMVVFMMRFSAYMGVELKKSNSIKDYSKFVDLDHVSSWAEESIRSAHSFNLIAGEKNRVDEWKINPRQAATRAEAAQIIYNYVTAAGLFLPFYAGDVAGE